MYNAIIVQYVFLFPGQGAQYVGMGRDFYEKDERVRDLFKTATQIGGFDVASLLFEGTIEELSATDRTQIAVTVVNIAAAYYLQSVGIMPIRVAGFSLGEYAALVIAGVISPHEALHIVKIRGDLMETASRVHDSDSARSGLVAVIGLSRDDVCTALETHNIENAYVAIHNSPSQIVIGGTPHGLQKACAVLERNAQIVPLKVSGPFHTTLMREAAKKYAAAIEKIQFRNPSIPIYSNVSGTITKTGEEIRRLCSVQITQTVEWVKEEKSLMEACASGVSFLEVGPGRVLGGLWRSLSRTYSPDIRSTLPSVARAGTCEEIDAIVVENNNISKRSKK